jgi:tetratricopeptide (TPR) repeat protein
MISQSIYVEDELFVGRVDEQNRFREALNIVLANQGNDASPFIFLIHGGGGMGKSQLTRRLYDIATTEAPFERDFRALRIDWEVVRSNTPALRVPRDQIDPEEVLAALHRAAVDEDWGRHFKAYQKVIEQRQKAEQEVVKALGREEKQDQYTAIRDLGASGLAKLVRLALPGVGPTGEELVRVLLAAGIQLGAEQAAQARKQADQFLKAHLTSDLYHIYLQPHEQLGRALGTGFRHVSLDRPLVLVLDTYEIVSATSDICLRQVIKAAEPRVVWVIAGRDDLATSRPRHRYVGYRAEFLRRLTAWDIQELAIEHVTEYLSDRDRAPDRSPTSDEAVALHRATLGVPLALRQAADLWAQGVELTTITEGTSDITPREELVRLMCERVLLHVEQGTAGQADRRALYALAMQPRADTALLAAILRPDDTPFDLAARLAELTRRYSVIQLAGGARLHETMLVYMTEYLLRTEESVSDLVTDIADQAVESLRARRAELEEDLFDWEEQVESEDWQQTTLDMINWLFWQNERTAWRELVPRLVEGLGYDQDFAESLLEVAGRFRPKLGKDGRKRLSTLQLDDDNRDGMLNELERLAKKGRWLDDDDVDATAERHTILLLWRGRWLANKRQLDDALQVYLAAQNRLPEEATNLQKQLGHAFDDLSGKFTWPEGAFFSRPSEPGLKAAQRAVALDPDNPGAFFKLGMAQNALGYLEEALAAFQRALQIDPEHRAGWHGQGLAHNNLGQYEEAVRSFKRVLELNPKAATSWSQLGRSYSALGRYEEAMEAYQQVISLNPNPQLALRAWFGLGVIHRQLGRYDEAIKAFQKAIELDPKAIYPHTRLGTVYQLTGRLEEALQIYRRVVELEPDNAMGYSSLASVLLKLGHETEAAPHLARARELMADVRDYDKACIEAIAGNREAALDYLAKGLTQRPSLRDWAKRDPDLESLHGHPRFEALVGLANSSERNH